MLLGLLAGILAGACWGFAFVAPVAVAPLSPFDLTVVRYLVFGAIALVSLSVAGWSAFRRLRRHDIVLLLALGFAGNVGFYLALSLAISFAGTTAVTLLVGCLPVVIAFVTSHGEDGPQLRHLAFPLGLILLGLVIVNRIQILQLASRPDLEAFGLGVGFALLAVAMWTWYSICNTTALAARPQMTTLEWTALTGVAALSWLLILIPVGVIAGLSSTTRAVLSWSDIDGLVVWGLVVGGVSSWGGTWAWSVATRRLPVALAGQLIVSETIFGLLYNGIYKNRVPTLAECSGICLLFAGVLASIGIFRKFDRHLVRPLP